MTLYDIWVCNDCSHQFSRYPFGYKGKLTNSKCPRCDSKDIELMQGPTLDNEGDDDE